MVNAAEGEPASFKDQALIAGSPHLVLDGAALAAAAVGASEVILGISDASAATAAAAHRAISERRPTPGAPAMRLVTVPRTYVSGQESALVNFLNGNTATPTFTPPMIFERGVRGRPTFLSNAETFAHMALIARHGANWFREIGTAEHPGSALITLSGSVSYPGVYEVEHGVSLRSLIDSAGGVLARPRAILLGGYAGTWIDAALLPETTFDDGWLAPRRASTGAGVIAVLGEHNCGVAETLRIADWLAAESAGQCGPCVHGLASIAARLRAWALSGDSASGPAELERLFTAVRGRGACRHPDGTLRFIASAMEVFAAEFADHARHGPCDACGARPALTLPVQSESRLAGAA